MSDHEDAEKVEIKKEHGVCYLQRIPPYMNPISLRKLLTQKFEIGRIYLEPESNKKYLSNILYS
jgi:ESF2/ABP1 family protein